MVEKERSNILKNKECEERCAGDDLENFYGT